MVPQSNDVTSKLGGLSSLASMAGINLSDMSGGQSISPTLYPQIMGSITYEKELLQVPVKFETIDQPISLYDSYVNEKYKKTTAFGFVTKYTIGLPGLILKRLKKKSINAASDNTYITLNEDEKRAIDLLSNKINLILNDKDGYLTLSASAPEPLVATQMVIAAQALLQKYITAIKVQKVQQNLDFIQGRYNEAKRDYENAQIRLASHQDLNRNVISAISKSQEDKLNNDYNLAFSVYTELAKQLEQAKIQVKDATPVLSIVQPAFIPIEKSKPKRTVIIFIWILMGIMFTSIYVLSKPLFVR